MRKDITSVKSALPIILLFRGCLSRYTISMPDAVLYITVKPKSPRNDVTRGADGVRVRVTAPPVEGAANATVIETVSKALGIPKSRLTISAGATGRVKRLSVVNMIQEELDARVAQLPENV